MSNPKFYYTDLTNVTITSSVGDDANFPSSNLNDYFVSPVWKSANNDSSQYLAIDMGSSGRTRKAIVVENHNLNGIMSSGAIKIQAADDNAFTSGLIDVDTNFAPTTSPYVKEFTSPSSKRYWRILFNGNLNSAPYIGNIFIDDFLDFGYGYEFPYQTGDTSYETTERTALDGTLRASQPYGGRTEFEIQFKLLNDAFKTSFQAFHSVVRGKLRPFYFLDMNG
ncbi:MAG: hypothetical protein EPO24_08415, partial [Bacteroidetes bacterium]